MILRFLFFWGLQGEILVQHFPGIPQEENGHVLNKEFVEELAFNLIEFLQSGENRDCSNSKYVVLEILGLIGKSSSYLQEYESLETLACILTHHSDDEVKKKAIAVLFELGKDGISCLVEVCREEQNLRNDLVTLMINCSGIIEVVIVPAFINKFHSSNHTVLHTALTALANLGCLASRSEAIPILLDLLMHSNLNKSIVCGALASFGEEGLKALVDCLGINLQKELVASGPIDWSSRRHRWD